MARPRSTTLKVCLNGRHVGALRRAGNGAVTFAYEASWLSWEHSFPISISMPLREENYSGDAVSNVFDNLLPDAPSVRKRIAERVAAGGDDAISLLAKIGRDCVGALQFLPPDADCTLPGEIEANAVSDADIANIVKSLATAPLGLSENDDAFRISIAGAQEKTALLLMNGKWMSPTGVTPTTHILKPQIGVRPFAMGVEIDLTRSVENEQYCMTFCEAIGLPTARSRIVDFNGVRVFVSERFDRQWTKDGRLLRLPQEDFCQALGISSSDKYEASGGPGISACMKLLQASDSPQEDRRIFMKAVLIYWVLGATDGHAKNFSIRMNPGGRFRLAPLYDVLSTQPHVATGQLTKKNAKLAMAVGKSRHYRMDEVIPRHFRETADAVGFARSELDAIEEDISSKLESAIKTAAASLPKDCPKALGDAIAAGARERVALLAL
jgi:serine/threonine-protein kinase HipA